MRISVIGMGYVGLTTSVVLAYLGNDVIGVDVDENKIERLKRGESPFFEPYLRELMELSKDKISFTTHYEDAIPISDVVFIAVGTPSMPDGSPNLQFLKDAAEKIGLTLGEGFTVIVNKSTVPVGSGNWVESLVRDSFKSRNGRAPDGRFAVVSNPEFLREGAAVFDSLYPTRIVIGSENTRAIEVMYKLYKPIIEQTFEAPGFLPRPDNLSAVPFITSDIASAELIKYAANAFLALKISFINEIAELAEKVGGNVMRVAQAIGLDPRIGSSFLRAGIGWGGSCFGKDTAALIATAQEYDVQIPIIKAAREVNYRQRERVVQKLLNTLKILKGKTIGILGLAFKPHTDDLRDSPAIDIAMKLIKRGVRVKAHDPVALERARKQFPNLDICYCNDVEELAKDADALILTTEWPEYKNINWVNIFRLMKRPLILDGRNFLNMKNLMDIGFEYIGMGIGRTEEFTYTLIYEERT